MLIKIISIGFLCIAILLLFVFLIHLIRNRVHWTFLIGTLFFMGAFSYIAYTIYKTPESEIYRNVNVASFINENAEN